MSGRGFDVLPVRVTDRVLRIRDRRSYLAAVRATGEGRGPASPGFQVFIRSDPRVTRVGHFLRRFEIDEFPQFWNVLRGEMSIVGPWPSPDGENQYCPAWREIRLSVRPGITGLWQLKRTRALGEDFQEWIKYDVEYVRRAGGAEAPGVPRPRSPKRDGRQPRPTLA